VSLQAAVTLVNSAESPDTLTTMADLDAFWAEFGFSGRHDRTRAELDEVRARRPRLRRLLSRNRSRRFCSTKCSNRNAVAAYRARQAQ
jgi:hypothetical protein